MEILAEENHLVMKFLGKVTTSYKKNLSNNHHRPAVETFLNIP